MDMGKFETEGQPTPKPTHGRFLRAGQRTPQAARPGVSTHETKGTSCSSASPKNDTFTYTPGQSPAQTTEEEGWSHARTTIRGEEEEETKFHLQTGDTESFVSGIDAHVFHALLRGHTLLVTNRTWSTGTNVALQET